GVQTCALPIFTANPDRLKNNLDRSISLVTALNPFIGYEAATAVAAEAYANGTNVRDVILRRQLMTESELDDALRHEVLTQPRVYELVNRAQHVDSSKAGDENG